MELVSGRRPFLATGRVVARPAPKAFLRLSGPFRVSMQIPALRAGEGGTGSGRSFNEVAEAVPGWPYAPPAMEGTIWMTSPDLISVSRFLA